jgi:hypothetical protein
MALTPHRCWVCACHQRRARPERMAMGDAGQLASLDFYLTDQQIRGLIEHIEQYGSRAAPATDPMAREQVRQLGQARFEHLGRSSNAMAQVRPLYAP